LAAAAKATPTGPLPAAGMLRAAEVEWGRVLGAGGTCVEGGEEKGQRP